MKDEKGDGTGHQKGDETGHQKGDDTGRQHRTPEADDEISIAQLMDELREAALRKQLGDALREHVGSAKRRKQRTRTSCEANTS